jgi:two-component system, NtrC family, response regulator HydG
VRSQRVLILAERAESGALARFFGLFEHGRAYEVLAAANRRETVSAMMRGRPDLIVLDPQMKELDGLQLLKQIRVIDQAVPVIIVAGTQKTQEAVEVLKVGVFAYVPKPCDFMRFEHLIALALPAGRPSTGDEAARP